MSDSNSLVIQAVGDIMPKRIEMGDSLEAGYVHVVDRLRDADVIVAQLECNLSTKGCLQYRNELNTWYGRSDPRNVESIKYAGINLITHASNHCFDYGPEALVETIEVLEAEGIKVIGVGRDLDEARRPAVFGTDGNRVAFLNYCAVLPEEFEARENKPGCAPLRVETYYQAQRKWQPGTPPRVVTIAHEEDVRVIEEDIQAARDQADVVILSMHWGIHFIPGMLADYETVVAHRAIDAGADLILGTHAHIPKPIVFYKGKAIFHCLGNFCQETPHHMAPPPGAYSGMTTSAPKYTYYDFDRGRAGVHSLDTSYMLMVRCEVRGGQITRLSFIPGRVDEARVPRFVTPDEPDFAEVTDYMRKWSEPYGTKLVIENDEVLVYPSE